MRDRLKKIGMEIVRDTSDYQHKPSVSTVQIKDIQDPRPKKAKMLKSEKIKSSRE